MARAPSRSAIANAIKQDDAARAAKGQSKREANRAAKAAKQAEEHAAVAALEAAAQARRDLDAEQAAHEATLRVDAEALGLTGAEADAYVAEQMKPADDTPEKAARERTYFGPMLALRDASKRYVKAANGILCNGDQLALACGKYNREVVVMGLVDALIEAKLEAGNRYAHMNPGQQSMNLRNRCRHQLAAGTISMAIIEANLDAAAIRFAAGQKA